MTALTQTPAPTPAGEGGVGAGHQPRTFDDGDRAILEFERLSWRHTGSKETEIVTRFAMSPARYYQVLGWVLEQPEALEYDAQLVNQLRRIRDLRASVRTRGTTASGVETRTDVRGTRPALLGGTL